MAGHSKWKQIKHKKALLDSKRGKLFTKLIKEITVAARLGGGDPSGNARLRFLLEKGKAINMPQENALRAIKKGTGELPGQSYESYTYEGYGPHQVAVIVDVLTDNKNKAIAELRHVFSRKGGHIGASGAVSWMFEKCGLIETEETSTPEDIVIELLLDYPVKDINYQDKQYEITCDPKALDALKKVLQEGGIKIAEAELAWVPTNKLQLAGEQESEAIEFLEELEDLEDVQHVYTNLA